MPLPDVQDVYEVAVKGVFGGQEIVNRFHYLSNEVGAPDYPTWLTNFKTTVWTPILTILSQDYVTQEVKFTPLFGTALGATLADSSSGGVSSPANLPPFMAWQFRLLHGDRRVRPGQKRFAGVAEQVVEGATFNSAYVTAVGNVNTALAAVVGDSVNLYTPVVVHYPSLKYPSVFTVEIQSAAFIGWTTQNSRKRGRGS